jgi:N-acetyl-alpha-D-glucosaminyl L-malate synthase BshA
MPPTPLKIGITCYPSVGGSGVVATALGEQLAHRGHDVHFIAYERPFRLSPDADRIIFHPVEINDYGLFKYPDYTLPLSVKMAEVTRDFQLDVLHVHYAVPHATAAVLARSMLPENQQPRIVTTLHGTDTTLLGRDPGYGPAIRHALHCSDAVTTVSKFLADQTRELLSYDRPTDVIHNFFALPAPKRNRKELRSELGIAPNQTMLLHCSNLRPVKRIDLLLKTAAAIQPRDSFKLVILAGDDFTPFVPDMRRLGLENSVIVRSKVPDMEEYLHAADIAVYTSETESFCLGILEAMWFACPSVATRVGGIPEVITDNALGLLTPFGDTNAMARAIEDLIRNPARRAALGRAGQTAARQRFSANAIVPQYEAVYRRLISRR